MSDKIPLKAIVSGSDRRVAEYAAGDTTPITHGGTGASNAATALTNLGGLSHVDVADEGSDVGDFTAFNFVGGGVTVTDVAGVATVNVPLGAGGLFGTELHEIESLSMTSTTSETFIQRLKLTTASLSGGRYRISYGFAFAISSNSKQIEVRVQLDDTTTLYELKERSIVGADPSQYKNQRSGFAYVTLSAGVHEVDIDFKIETSSTTAYIQDVRIELWRAS